MGDGCACGSMVLLHICLCFAACPPGPPTHQEHFSIPAPAVARGAGRLWILELSTEFVLF